MLDIHSHILPGIDDGSKNIENTIEMLKIAKDDGIEKIIATPHFYKFNYENSYSNILTLIEEVRQRAIEEDVDIDILPGQEVYLDEFTLNHYKEGIIGTLNNSNYMLVELNPGRLEKEVFDIIYELRIEGVTPIIAHPERYDFVHEKLSSLNYFIKEGCLFQINAGSIMGKFGKIHEKTAQKLLQHGICDFIATDAHSVGTRKPAMKNALDQTLKKYLDLNIKYNWQELLKNGTISYERELLKEKKSFFCFLRK